ncbi:hypothetical protein APR08_002144 [Nocardia amikacinitolerans]|nr:hypothetical protein [Nocardia amikacinitolerans]
MSSASSGVHEFDAVHSRFHSCGSASFAGSVPPRFLARSMSVSTTGSKDSKRAGTFRPAFQSLIRWADAGFAAPVARMRFSAWAATLRSVGFPAAAYRSANRSAKTARGELISPRAASPVTRAHGNVWAAQT